MTGQDRILVSMRKQFESFWSMFFSVFDVCTPEEWREAGVEAFATPARLMLHIVETVDYYFDAEPEAFDWGREGDWRHDAVKALPSEGAMRDYAREVRHKTEDWFTYHEAEDCNAHESTFGTDWETDLERVVYVLRHSQHHLGQLSLELQRRGLPEILWE